MRSGKNIIIVIATTMPGTIGMAHDGTSIAGRNAGSIDAGANMNGGNTNGVNMSGPSGAIMTAIATRHMATPTATDTTTLIR